MRTLITITALIVLTGCAEWNALQSGVANHGAQAADEAVETALWSLCSGVPVGAIKRRFKTDDERAAYNQLCPEPELP